MITSQSNTVSDELVEKCRKLLSLGNSNNQAEAELALSKCKALAVKYNIDLSLIDINKNSKPEPFIKNEGINLGKRESTCQKYIYDILVRHFNVKIVTEGGRYWGSTMFLIGKKTDIELSTYINSFLNAEMPRLWKKYYESTPGVTLDKKQSYLYGLSLGIQEKLEESKKKAEQEKFEEIKSNQGNVESEKAQTSYALMIKTDKEKLQSALEDFYPKLRSSSRSWGGISLNSSDAIAAGKSAGKNISFNRPIGPGTNSNRISC